MSVLKHKISQAGFTIVELVTVIVVIGILASIGVVAYNGAQERSRNAARLTAVGQMKEVVEVALTKKTALEIRSSLNLSGGWWRACIGTGYKDINSDGKGDCAYYNNSPYVSTNAPFETLLTTYSDVPNMAGYPKSTATDGDIITGPYVGSAWVDSKDMLVLEYSLEGLNQKCKFTPLVYRSGGSDSLTPAGGASPDYTKSEYGVTECVVVVSQDF